MKPNRSTRRPASTKFPQHQPRIRGIRRAPVSSVVIEEIEEAIHHTQQRFNVSRSFVIAYACAQFFGIEIDKWNTRRG